MVGKNEGHARMWPTALRSDRGVVDGVVDGVVGGVVGEIQQHPD